MKALKIEDVRKFAVDEIPAKISDAREEMMKLRQIKTLRKYSCPLCQFEEMFQLSLFVHAQKLL